MDKMDPSKQGIAASINNRFNSCYNPGFISTQKTYVHPISSLSDPHQKNVVLSTSETFKDNPVQTRFANMTSHCSTKHSYRQEGLTFAQVVKIGLNCGSHSSLLPKPHGHGDCAIFSIPSQNGVQNYMGFCSIKNPSYPKRDSFTDDIPKKTITTFHCEEQCCSATDFWDEDSEESLLACNIPPILSAMDIDSEMVMIP